MEILCGKHNFCIISLVLLCFRVANALCSRYKGPGNSIFFEIPITHLFKPKVIQIAQEKNDNKISAVQNYWYTEKDTPHSPFTTEESSSVTVHYIFFYWDMP